MKASFHAAEDGYAGIQQLAHDAPGGAAQDSSSRHMSAAFGLM
jgi:hypothetical protein